MPSTISSATTAHPNKRGRLIVDRIYPRQPGSWLDSSLSDSHKTYLAIIYALHQKP